MVPKKNEKRYILDSSLGWNMLSGMAIFTFIGWVVDEKKHTHPWGILSGILGGLLYGGYETWKTIRSLEGKK